jgi:hypothetical protein
MFVTSTHLSTSFMVLRGRAVVSRGLAPFWIQK